ncbi:MAG: ISNCY family transposase [Myxococcales bacterium]|nr:ISNCY family transposase [Myxococcales bacterium]
MERTMTMTEKELSRLHVLRAIHERRLTQAAGARELGLSTRHLRRLVRSYETDGPQAVVSKRRGRPSNHRLPEDLRVRALELVREKYADFGPTFAAEKLAELDGIWVSRETLRSWMVTAGLWIPRQSRRRRSYQPRNRRPCVGELVQIDGCLHDWFEERGDRVCALVFVDDATGRLQQLHFAHRESAFDHFEASRGYLERHGKPVAFYSDKHSVFRVANRDSAASDGLTQFGRALHELNVDIICANTPQAKGRVERAHQTLQDRLVKELRLRQISTIEEANAYVPAFMEAYNERFARPPAVAHDAHRPLLEHDRLEQIFTWQEERKLTRNLVIHFKRQMFLIEDTEENRALRGRRVRVYEQEDGSVWAIRCGGRDLAFTEFRKDPHVDQAAVVENKHLGAALRHIAAQQAERDEKLLTSRKLTLREKRRLRASRERAAKR